MQVQGRYHNKENRVNTEAVIPNRSIRKKTNHQKSVGALKKAKRKQQIFNLEKFISNLKPENFKTERFNSPNKNKNILEIVEKRQNSSKSRQFKSIQTSREKSGDTYKKTQRTKILHKSKSKPKNPKLNQCLSILSVSSNTTFKQFTLQMCDKFQQVQNCLKSKNKQQNKQNIAYNITKKYKQLFSTLVTTMIKQINLLFDMKESEIITNIENITTLQNDILEKQSICQKLELEKTSLQEELQYADKIIERQNKYIFEIKQKESRISKLLYILRRKGIDIDQIYSDQIQTPIQQSIQEDEQQVVQAPSQNNQQNQNNSY